MPQTWARLLLITRSAARARPRTPFQFSAYVPRRPALSLTIRQKVTGRMPPWDSQWQGTLLTQTGHLGVGKVSTTIP